MKLERDIVKSIRDYIKSIGGMAIKYHGDQYAQAGVSDLLCCIEGKFYAFEVKREAPAIKYCTDAQKLFMATVIACGGRAYPVSSVDEVKEILHDKLDN